MREVIISKLLFLILRYVLKKDHKALSKIEKLQKSLKFASGGTACRAHPKIY